MDRSERIRTLKNRGLSEEDAVRRAHAEGSSVIDYTGRTRVFAIVTKDMSGFGWAKRLREEGESVVLVAQNDTEDADDEQRYQTVGKGWVPRMTLTEAQSTLRGRNTYWIFTENNFPEVADRLRKAGQKVFGTGLFSDQMEHDRGFAIDRAHEQGLRSPASEEFHSRDEGLKHLDAHPDTAFVLKPDEGVNAETFVPELEEDEAANEETYTYLEHLPEEPSSYILQERVRGVEVNVELDFSNGEPFFAFVTLEAKRKNPSDQGTMSGCAGDLLWAVPIDAPLVQQTIGTMLPLYREKRYTGPADANIILTDTGPVFLEACNRFGYNAHVTLFTGLALDTFGNLMADWMDGKVQDFSRRFRPDFAASVTLFLDHPTPGLPITEKGMEQFYPFDGYKEKGKTLLAGYSSEVGIMVGEGATPEAAFDAVYAELQQEAVSYPGRYYREDLADTGYSNAILDRWRQLDSLGLTGREKHPHRNDSTRGPAVSHRGGLPGTPGSATRNGLRARGLAVRVPRGPARAGGDGADEASGDLGAGDYGI